jgi:hypothetical protein
MDCTIVNNCNLIWGEVIAFIVDFVAYLLHVVAMFVVGVFVLEVHVFIN